MIEIDVKQREMSTFPPATVQNEENKAKTLIFQIPTKKFHIQEKQIKKH